MRSFFDFSESFSSVANMNIRDDNVSTKSFFSSSSIELMSSSDEDIIYRMNVLDESFFGEAFSEKKNQLDEISIERKTVNSAPCFNKNQLIILEPESLDQDFFYEV